MKTIIDKYLSLLADKYKDFDFSDVPPARYGSGWTALRNSVRANDKRSKMLILRNLQHCYIVNAGVLPESYFDDITSCPVDYLHLLGSVKCDEIGLSTLGYFFMTDEEKSVVQSVFYKKVRSQRLIKNFDREMLAIK
jgi:hypothetical protein